MAVVFLATSTVKKQENAVTMPSLKVPGNNHVFWSTVRVSPYDAKVV